MRSMRNRMVHMCFHVDPDILWKTVQDDLPLLVPHLENLLLNLPSKDDPKAPGT